MMHTMSAKNTMPATMVSIQIVGMGTLRENFAAALIIIFVYSFLVSKKYDRVIFSFASIILAIVVIAIVSYNIDFTSFVENTSQPISSSNLIPPYIRLVTDEKSYQKADIISVSGETNPVIQGKIRVTVENTQGKVIWAENVQVKDNGEFSTLLISGGNGWEKNGQYTLLVKHDSLETKTLFDFSS